MDLDPPNSSRKAKESKIKIDTLNGNGDIMLLCEWSIPYTGTQEEIIFASFLEDINPDFIIVVSRQKAINISKIYVLKVNQKLQKEADSSN